MKKTNGKIIGRIIFGFILALCAIFPFGIVLSNRTAEAIGGGVSVESGGNIEITGGTITNNYNHAIVIEIAEGETVTIKDTKITDSSNGAIKIVGCGTLNLENVVIEGNTNDDNGGAVFVDAGATLNIKNSRIENNIATGLGGAIYAADNSRVNISGNTIISGNEANLGGGIYLAPNAFLNNGENSLEYFSDNISYSENTIWDNIYYEYVNLDITTTDEFFNSRVLSSALLKNVGYAFDIEYQRYWALAGERINGESFLDQQINQQTITEGLATISIESVDKVKYELSSDGTYYIASANLLNGESMFAITGAVKVVDFYNDGLPVKEVKANGFKGAKQITSLEIGSNVNFIGDYAFANTYENQGEIVDLIFNNSPASIGSWAFQFNTKLVNVDLGNKVTSIRKNAFNFCTSLREIYIPASVTSVWDYPFLECFKLSTLVIDGANPKYSSYDQNCIVDKTSGKLIQGTIGTSEVPEGVKIIAVSAFDKLADLKTLSLPNTIEEIQGNAFRKTGLTSLIIPSSVETLSYNLIEDSAVKNLTIYLGNLKSIRSTAFVDCSLSQLDLYLDESNVSSGELYGLHTSFSLDTRVFVNIDAENVFLDGETIPHALLTENKYIKTVTLSDSVKYLSNSVFYNCTGLTSVVCGKNVEVINYDAFYGCVSLKEINLDSVKIIQSKAFGNCQSLKEVSLKDCWLTDRFYDEFSYAINVFDNCTSLTKVTLDNVTSTDYDLFTGAPVTDLTIKNMTNVPDWFSYCAIRTLSLDNSVVSKASNAFASATVETLTIDMTTIPNWFAGVWTLNKVNIGPNVQTVGQGAFENCSGLNIVSWSNGVKNIENNAFKNCTALDNLDLPHTVEIIGANAFYSCNAMDWIDFSDCDNLTSIGRHAFFDCRSLVKVFVDSDVWFNIIFENERSNPSYNPNDLGCGLWLDETTKWENVVVPEGVTEIKNYAFASCGIKSIDFNGVQKIGDYAFYQNKTLSNIEFPDTLESIGNRAFQWCEAFTTLNIPASVTHIGQYVFDGCININTITVNDSNTVYYSAENAIITEVQDDFMVGETAVVRRPHTLIFGSKGTTIDNSVWYIGRRAFYKNTVIKQTEIPETVVELEHYAFYGCSALTTVSVGAGMQNIGLEVFGGCTALTSLTFVNAYNWQGYSDETLIAGNVLFTDSSTNIVYFTNESHEYYNFTWVNTSLAFESTATTYSLTGREVGSVNVKAGADFVHGNIVIPSIYLGNIIVGVAEFGFANQGILNITFPDTVTYLGGNAFNNCSDLISITIPSSVTSIGTQAFYNCSSLSTINYNASVAEDGCTSSHNIFVGAGNGSAIVTINSTVVPQYLFYNCDGIKKIDYSYTDNTSAEKTIGTQAFYDCDKIEQVILPEGLKTIKNSTFYSCDSLSLLDLPAGLQTINNKAFQGCKIQEIVLPDSVTNVGDYAFDSNGLLTATLGKNLQSLGTDALGATLENLYYNSTYNITKTIQTITGGIVQTAVITPPTLVDEVVGYFYEYNSLVNVTMGEGSYLGYKAFYACPNLVNVTINAVKAFGSYAFYDCNKLESAIVNTSKVGDYAFAYCEKLTISGLVLNSDIVSTIGNYAFDHCTGLVGYLVIQNKITTIGSNAFRNCTGLTGIWIGSNVTSIGAKAFYNCSSLESIFYGGSAEDNSDYDSNPPFEGAGNGNTKVQLNATNIPFALFYKCTGIKEIEIYSNVETISQSVFNGCTALESITYKDTSKITSIGNYAFYGCSALTSITIPNSVTSIGDYAFYACRGVSEVYYTANIATDFNSSSNIFGAIGGSNGVSVYVTETSRVPAYLFYNCTNVKSVAFGPTVNTIGNYAFYGCNLENYANVDVPLVLTSVTSIGERAFENTNIYSIKLNSNIEFIGAYAFDDSVGTIYTIEGSTQLYVYDSESATNVSTTYYSPYELKENGLFAGSYKSLRKYVWRNVKKINQ